MNKNRFISGTIFTFSVITIAIAFNALIYPSILTGATGWVNAADAVYTSNKQVSQPPITIKYLSEKEAIYKAKAEIERPSFSTAKLETKTKFLSSDSSGNLAIWQVLFLPKDDAGTDLSFCSVILDAYTGESLSTTSSYGTAADLLHNWGDVITIMKYDKKGDLYYNLIYLNNDAQAYKYETGVSSKDLMDKFTYPSPVNSAISSGPSA